MNKVHRLDGLFRQSVYGRLAGYEDVNDADPNRKTPVTTSTRTYTTPRDTIRDLVGWGIPDELPLRPGQSRLAHGAAKTLIMLRK